jgi:serine/threonine-protein kinase
MHEAIERYLDGERDHEMRKREAERHAVDASRIVDSLLAGTSKDEAHDRARAMRDLGTALAFDPSMRLARKTMLRLLTEPPKGPIPQLEAALDRSREELSVSASRGGALGYAVWFLFAPLWALMGVRDLGLSSLIWTAIALAFVTQVCGMYWRRWLKFDCFAGAVLGGVIMAFLSRMFGPLVLVPPLAVAIAAFSALDPVAWKRWVFAVVGSLAIAGPLGLEWVGAIPSSYLFRDGMMCIVPQATALPPIASISFLLLSALGSVVITTLIVARSRRELAEAEERLHRHAWHLSQLVR